MIGNLRIFDQKPGSLSGIFLMPVCVFRLKNRLHIF